MEKIEAWFTTTSAYLAAFLRMRGFPFALKDRGGVVVFAFIPSPSLKETISEFNDNAFVQVAAFTSTVKKVRGEMRKKLKASLPGL